MNVTYRPFGGDADVQKLKDFLVMANADLNRPNYWHVGDLVWGLYQNMVFDPYQSIHLWEDDDGELLAFTWREGSDGVSWQIHPRLRGGGCASAEPGGRLSLP